MYLLGTDIGTQGDQNSHGQRKGELIADAFQEYEVITPRPSWAEQWPEVWLEAVVKTISRCVEKSKVTPLRLPRVSYQTVSMGGSGIPVDEGNKTSLSLLNLDGPQSQRRNSMGKRPRSPGEDF